ncbi:MAG: ABC transporter permease subunit [Spirochaetales bacterium]|nr:ABC transporter permease subunit [Spirochaetales bacterium]
MRGKYQKGLILIVTLSPLLIPFILFFSAGIGFAFIQAFGLIGTTRVRGGLFGEFTRLFTDPWFAKSFFYSLYVAFFSSVFSVIIGTFIAYNIWKLPHRLKVFSQSYTVPLILPHISIAFIILILAGRTGFFSSLLYNLGIIRDQIEFPSLLFGGNGIGIIIAYIYKETPFVVLMLLALFKKINLRMVDTARMLGAGKTAIFFRIILPFLLPAINSTFVILFLYGFGAFDIPFILSESNPEMLSISVFNLYFRRDISNRPYAMAMLIVMFLFACFFILLYTRIHSLVNKKEKT